MTESNQAYRIRTNVGTEDPVIRVNLKQDFQFIETLSLRITQEDVYKFGVSNTGLIIGRILANDGFGVPNAKISVFISKNSDDSSDIEQIYNFTSTQDKDLNGVRYNLLPDESSDPCYQNVGTFPNKRYLLDNDLLVEVYEEYYKFTTTSNQAGDYMIYGVPVGSCTLHVDIDLSDIGVLSQRPRDMVYKGYDINQFESPNKFKTSTNLNSLPQIYTQNKSIYVYPFWGDSSETEIAITRCDVSLDYKFEPTAIFMGSAFRDSGSSIGKDCVPGENVGKMSDFIATEGSIEMIRKTIDNNIEEYEIKGTRLIDGNGVWCYQIPMNLDYMITDEYGNMIITDDPTKGIPTRSRVRFRISLDSPGDIGGGKTTASYLIPNNPTIGEMQSDNNYAIDYNFGTTTRDSSFVDLLWNKVYSLKNYIPRTQSNDKARTRNFLGIKDVDNYGSNSPFPYNNVILKFGMSYIIMCLIMNVIIVILGILNSLVSVIDDIIDLSILGIHPFRWIGCVACSHFSIEDENGNEYWYYPSCGAGCGIKNVPSGVGITRNGVLYSSVTVMDVIQEQLANEYDVILFDFFNDWVNGSLYFPLYEKKVVKKKRRRFLGLFGSYVTTSQVQFCNVDAVNSYSHRNLRQPCSIQYDNNYPSYESSLNSTCENGKCDQQSSNKTLTIGSIKEEHISTDYYYYYTPSIVENNNIIFLHTTDVVLLGGVNDCDIDGLPALHQYLPHTTYKMPPSLVTAELINGTQLNTMAGVDWGGDINSGLFLGMTCTAGDIRPKSCVNAERICEIGADINQYYTHIEKCTEVPEYVNGLITYKELDDTDVRGMFATLNSTKLTTIAYNGYDKYYFSYNYPTNFDGRLSGMESIVSDDADYNYNLFRLGKNPLFYHANTYQFPRFINSFYFYFGLKNGSTALNQFNSQFYAPCSNLNKTNVLYRVDLNQPTTICDSGTTSVGIAEIIIEEGDVISVIVTDKNNIQQTMDLYYPKNGIYKFSNLSFGQYTVTITDSSNKTIVSAFNIIKPLGITFTYNTSDMQASSSDVAITDCSNPTTNTSNKKGNIIITNVNSTNNSLILTLNDINRSATYTYNVDVTNISLNPITYYLCTGSYYITLTDPTCSENYNTSYFSISEPNQLDITVNGLSYLNILNYLTSYNDWKNLAYQKWDKTNVEVLPLWSSGALFTNGEYILYNTDLSSSATTDTLTLYKCNTTHTSGSQFNSSYFDYKITYRDRSTLTNSFSVGTLADYTTYGYRYGTTNATLSLLAYGGVKPYTYSVTFPPASSSGSSVVNTLNTYSNLDNNANFVNVVYPSAYPSSDADNGVNPMPTPHSVTITDTNGNTLSYNFYLYFTEQVTSNS